MNILLRGRRSFHQDPGGDAVQTVKYQEYLIRGSRPCAVRIDLESEPDFSGVDVVHCFNLQVTDQTYCQLRQARERGKKVVFSPIYWSLDEYRRHRYAHARALGQNPAREFLRNHFDAHLHAFQAWRRSGEPGAGAALGRLLLAGKRGLQRKCLELADRILVSAPSERDILLRDFPGLAEAKVRVVPNGVDTHFAAADPEPFIRRYGRRDFLLAVGRMEPHKNQIAVLRALRNLEVPVVFIGSQRDARYLEACRRLARTDALFLDVLPHEFLPAAYAAARAHILASWFDIPGLVSLEAGLAGCNVISTDRGSARDYLGDGAWYANPADEGSIHRAVAEAMAAPRGIRGLAARLQAFSWERVAETLYDNYAEVLAQP